MTLLQRYFTAQIPIWARPDNPVLRYTLQRFGRRRGRLVGRLARAVLAVVGIGLLALSYRAYDAGEPLLVSQEHTSALFALLYFPLLLVQLGALLWALVLTANMLPGEQRRGTWEPLKITSHGAEMAMRARWAAVFYQMRWVLVALLVPRILFAAQMLLDLADYQGRHLDLYMMGITPELPVEAGVMLLAAFMAAALLALLVAVGLNAAIGLLISTVFRNRQLALFAQVVALLAQLGLFMLALAAGFSVIDQGQGVNGAAERAALGQWPRVLLMVATGDQGLRLMDLRTFLETWPGIDYGVFLGLGALAVLIVQAVFTNGLLEWAARRAARPARE